MSYHRPYSFYSNQRFPFIKFILFANFIFFVFSHIAQIWFNSHFFTQYFGLTGYKITHGFLWTPISYGFLHADILHILINSLLIFFVGRVLEESLNTKRLAILYFTSLIGGALFWLLLNFKSIHPLVGASAAGLGLLTFFCLHRPDEMVTLLLFFFIPINIKPRSILWITLFFEIFGLLFEEIPGKSIVASSAHLGGMAAGFLCYQVFMRRRLFTQFTSSKMHPSRKFAKNLYYRVNITSKDQLKEEVDRILDKINAKGFGSLSNHEKSILDQAKDLLNR